MRETCFGHAGGNGVFHISTGTGWVGEITQRLVQLFIVNHPYPLIGILLNRFNSIKQVCVKNDLTEGFVKSLDIAIMIRFSCLDEN